MSDRRISVNRIMSAINDIRVRGEEMLNGAGQDVSGSEMRAFGTALLAAAFDLENGLEIAHPEQYARPVTFEVKRELFLPGRFIRYAVDKGIDVGEIRKDYQNGDVRLAANNEDVAALRAAAETVLDPNIDESTDRGIKTAARALLKSIEKQVPTPVKQEQEELQDA